MESAGKDLKCSQYSVIVADYPQAGKHLVFNTFTHALVCAEDWLKEFILNPDGPIRENHQENIEKLKRMRILVDRNLDETAVARKWYNLFRNDKSTINATILTTYDCNFACKYCIEEGVRKPVYMDDQCSDAVSKWLINRAKENGTKKIVLSFYGGEPLLNQRPIYRISEEINQFAMNNEISFESYITTNGALIKSEMLQDLMGYGLKSVKVTIDGVREVHDARRPFESGSGSFDVIVANIRKIPEDVKLIVQSNLDVENIDRFPELLDFFESSKLKGRIHNLVISPVDQSLGQDSVPAVHRGDCSKMTDSQVLDELITVRRLAMERGFISQKESVNYTICGMNRSNSIVNIDPVGDIYSCPALVGRDGFSIGNIYNGKLDRSQEFSDHQLEDCFRCGLFPVCGSGCRYRSYMLYGDHNRIHCERGDVESRTKKLVKLRYDQRAMHEKSA